LLLGAWPQLIIINTGFQFFDMICAEMSKSLVRAVLILVVAIAAIAGAVFFLNNRPLSVEVARIEKNAQVQVFGLGTVEAQVVSSIGFEVGAALVEVTVDHGSVVKRGDILARLHAAEQKSRVARAEAGVHSAEAVLDRAAAMFDRQTAVLAQKEEISRRQQELVKKNVVSVEKAAEAAKELKVAEADHALAMADTAVARAAIETARADLAHETTILAHHNLFAPFDAIVVKRHMELGTVLKIGDPIYTIVDPNSVWILAHVEEARAGAIAVGQGVDVSLRSLPGSVYQGRVARLGIESDRISEERRVWVKCEQCPVDFHLGEQAEVIITTATLPDALLVPDLMVSRYDGRSGTVWAVQNGAAQRIEVTFGNRTLDGRLEVKSKLAPGTEIITGPLAGLREGRAVRISAEPTP
jgi:HlyD family secretion protein